MKASAFVEHTAIAMSPTTTTRLPYAKDFRLDVQPAKKLLALTVFYSLDKSSYGARSGRVVAIADADGCFWKAPMPRLHVNESGTVRLDQFTSPALREPGKGLAVTLLEQLATIPSGLPTAEFRAAASSRAVTAVAKAYKDSTRVVVRAPDGSFVPLHEQLTESIMQNLEVKNTASDLRRQLRNLAERGQAVIDAKGAEPPPATQCATGTTVAATVKQAAAVLAGGSGAVLDELSAGRIPYPDCAVTLFQQLVDANAKDAATAANAGLALIAVKELNSAPGYAALAAIAARAEALEQTSLALETLDVPVGGAMLERYTQSDVMTVTLPSRYHLVQPFATAALYMFQSWIDNPQLTASVEPRNWSSDRLALQFGYPVGSAIHPPDEPLDVQYLIGAQYRLNSVLSISSGSVVGKVSGVQRGFWYLGTNLDVSNLGPFQQLFARRDQP